MNCPEVKEKVGQVESWDHSLEKGLIVDEEGSQWSFQLQNCVEKVEDGFILFSAGDRVTMVDDTTSFLNCQLSINQAIKL